MLVSNSTVHPFRSRELVMLSSGILAGLHLRLRYVQILQAEPLEGLLEATLGVLGA